MTKAIMDNILECPPSTGENILNFDSKGAHSKALLAFMNIKLKYFKII
jgi:hypothetical protein